MSKDKKWIQKATASIKKRGTEGVCTGAKFGGPSCPPGSKRYNLAKTFKKMAKKQEDGGVLDKQKPKLIKKKKEMNVIMTDSGFKLDDFRQKLLNATVATKKGGY